MSGKLNIDGVVNVFPIGMMFVFLGVQSDSGHEGECVVEILKFE